jgi:tetratricopeptide (TPR) repeat protein
MAEARHTAKFDFAKHEFEVDGSPVHLTTLDALYVKYLARNAARVVSRTELLTECNEGKDYLPNTVDTRIKSIRRSLGDDNWIKTVRGQGYRWIDLSAVDGLATAAAVDGDDLANLGDAEDAKGFYSGGPTVLRHVAASFDIARTQYATGEELLPAWREFWAAERTLTSRHLRVALLLGPAGAGKRTLAARVLHDWRAAGAPMIDALDGPLDLPPPGRTGAPIDARFRSLFVTKMVAPDTQDVDLLAARIRALPQRSTLLLVADTNIWRQIEPRFLIRAPTAAVTAASWTLNHVLDAREIDDLIVLLRKHSALRLRASLSNEHLRTLFSQRANNGLLTCLLEVVRGSAERESLTDIVRREFEALPDKAQWAYTAVAVATRTSLSLPADLVELLVADLAADDAYYASAAFHRELADVIVRDRHAQWRLRHRLLATTITRILGERYPVMVEKTLTKLLVLASDYPNLFATLLRRGVLAAIIHNNALERVVNDLGTSILTSHEAVSLYNHCARLFSSRRQVARALRMLEQSLRRDWSQTNPARYLQAYVLLGSLDGNEKASAIAKRIIHQAPNREHLYHAILVLARLGDFQAAADGRAKFERTLTATAGDERELKELDAALNQLRAAAHGTRPSSVLAGILAEARAGDHLSEKLIASASTLLARVPDYHALVEKVSRFATQSFHGSADRTPAGATALLVAEAWRAHVAAHDGGERKYPAITLSALLANAAHLTLLAAKVHDLAACRRELDRAVSLDPNNVWARLWLSDLLHNAGDSDAAISNARAALAEAPQNPWCHIALAGRVLDQPRLTADAVREAVSILDALLARPLTQANGVATSFRPSGTEARWRSAATELLSQATARLTELSA